VLITGNKVVQFRYLVFEAQIFQCELQMAIFMNTSFFKHAIEI
jgi:hypothetical protein